MQEVETFFVFSIGMKMNFELKMLFIGVFKIKLNSSLIFEQKHILVGNIIELKLKFGTNVYL